MLTGVEAGLRAQGIKDFTAVGFAGDGGTADIGIQALSGAIDRNDDIIYICYDNEAYMNTGVQKSSLTPFGAKTTTTPAGKNIRGNLRPKKNMFEIVAAHGIPYAATASVGYLNDFINKVHKASTIRGTKYIHIIAPCSCGRTHGRIHINGRKDDMFIVSAVNVFPSDIEAVIRELSGITGEYLIRVFEKDFTCKYSVEIEKNSDNAESDESVASRVAAALKARIGVKPYTVVVHPDGGLDTRSEHKSRRIIDERKLDYSI